MSEHESDPAANPATTGKDRETASKAEDGSRHRRSISWIKKFLAVAGAIVTIGGAVTVVSHLTHWLDFYYRSFRVDLQYFVGWGGSISDSWHQLSPKWAKCPDAIVLRL